MEGDVVEGGGWPVGYRSGWFGLEGLLFRRWVDGKSRGDELGSASPGFPPSSGVEEGTWV